MCGIAGIFRLTGPPSVEDAVAVLRMLDAQIHRGPDDWGLVLPDTLGADPDLRRLLLSRPSSPEHVRTYPAPGAGPSAILGTRRLSIIDLSSRGRMPMGSGDRRWIAHNGEIYNHQALRADLAAGGAEFRSSTDTEVILGGYAAWGDRVLQRLRGMFALAVFEAAPHPRLLLARDRLGIKPLYYHQDRERLIFASEVRALLRSGMVPDETNADALIRFLQWGSVPVPHTTIKDVLALPAGHSLALDADGTRLEPYGDPAAGPRESQALARLGRPEVVARTRALLEEAVRLHLTSDVPLGVFLSGGIDSSGLVALSSRLLDAPVTTLSVVFDEPGYSEAAYARAVAARYGTDHREVRLRAGDVFEALPRFFAAMDEPTVDGVNTWFISEAARRSGLTVVLSGTGGDEVFLGYAHLRRGVLLHRLRTMLATLPAPLRRALLLGVRRAGAMVGRAGLERLEYLERPSAESLYLAVRGLFGPGQIRDLLELGETEPAEWVAGSSIADDQRTADALARLEFAHYLQNQLLKDTDVMGMAHSLEIRVPYLDHELVRWVVGLPRSMKLGGARHKPLLVDALDGLPREIWARPKMGFTFPFAPWMRERAAELEAISLEGKLLHRKAVEGVWSDFRHGRLHWSRAWALVVLARFDAARKQRVAA